jgi:predicted nucleic acid-binding protein
LKNIFLDTNIILDFYLRRSPHDIAFGKILSLIFEKRMSGYISALSYANIFYLLRKENKRETIMDLFRSLQNHLTTVSVTSEILLKATDSKITDFEDAIQYECASSIKIIDAFLTRDKKDFRKGNIAIFLPDEFLKIYLTEL